MMNKNLMIIKVILQFDHTIQKNPHQVLSSFKMSLVTLFQPVSNKKTISLKTFVEVSVSIFKADKSVQIPALKSEELTFYFS